MSAGRENSRRLAVVCLWAGIGLLAGCVPYADFTLPPAAGGDPRTTFVFEPQAAPVTARGEAGAWDARDVLNPSVVRANSGLVNLYSGYDGRTWRTGLATSDDGVHWRKQGMILEPDPKTWEGAYIAANGAALFHANEFWYWYQAGGREVPRLGLARSSDGRTWRKEPAPMLEPGPLGSWDERGVADPGAIRVGDFFYLYYLGQDRARRQRIGLARSRDGIRWAKLRSNPVLELGEAGAFDEAGLGEPTVWSSHGFYWMLYTGRDTAERRRLGLARSTDGTHWRKLPVVFGGSESWDSQVVCDPSVLAEPSGIRVWFGGGDVARPDENLHGQIGLAILRPVSDTLAK